MFWKRENESEGEMEMEDRKIYCMKSELFRDFLRRYEICWKLTEPYGVSFDCF